MTAPMPPGGPQYQQQPEGSQMSDAWHLDPRTGQAVPGEIPCRCGRESQGGYCSGCWQRDGSCTCTSFAKIAAAMVPGGCVLDEPAAPPAIWGDGSEVLAAAGESTVICGPDGVGKTTLSGVLIRALLGLGPGEPGVPRKVLGYTVALIPPGKRVLYLAMDRPRQAMRALARLFGEGDRAVLNERLLVWKGPPPDDLARDPGLLAEMCRMAGAQVCFVDSLKDAAIGLTEDITGASWNRARQLAIQGGTELFELHHPRKATGDNPKPRNLEDVYGSRWIPAGAGSVIFLWGKAGDAVVELYHRKQPADEISQLHMVIDQAAGTVSAEEAGNIVAMVTAQGATDFTAITTAQLMFGTLTPDRNQVEKARRKLARLEKEGKLLRSGGGERGGPAATWQLPPGLAPAPSANGRQQAESNFAVLYQMADFRR